MQADLALQNIDDPLIRENFYRLLKYFNLQPLMNADFKFFEVDLPKAGTLVSIKHGLNFIPKDIIVLSAIGDNNYYFKYQAFDKTNLYVTNLGPVRLRFLAGNYAAPGLKNGPVEYPFVPKT